MARQGKECSVIATQIPNDFNRRQIEENFSIIGPVKKCHLVRDKDGTFKGVAYIVYNDIKDATEAVDKLNNSTLNEKIIKVKLTRQRDNGENNCQRAGKDGANHDGSLDQEKGSRKRKRPEKKQKNRNGRIIIRNLSFKADEKAIEDHFSQYGKISEVSILKKSNGKMVGCAFVQYNTKIEALKAIKECNMKPLLGRPIAVDLAVPKEKFAPVKVKTEEPEIEESTQVKEEASGESMHVDGVENNENVKIKEERFSSDSGSEDSGLEKDGDSEIDDDDDYDDEEKHPATNKSYRDGPSKDIAEERTLFIKNLSYEATEEDIRQVLETYGAVKYVLLCIDRLTQHPRGTAFAQFLEREAADNCLEAEKDPSTKFSFILHGRPMHIMRAISRKELQDRKSDDKEVLPKDKRNLYLAREGFVREGTLAAQGISKADMALRIKREQVKRRMLKNLHIFVSPTRLCINNLPKTVTDKELGRIFKSRAPKEATLTETRVMKNLKNLDDNGKPMSRGYGFVSFTKHEHALAALRSVNNNPEVFTNEQRPIVEFSLENRCVLKAREKRLEKSREKNPLWNKKAASTAVKGDSVNANKLSKKNDDDMQKEASADSSFMGSKSNPQNRDLPTNFGPKVRHAKKSPAAAKISRKQLKKEQRDRVQGKKRRHPQNSEMEMESPKKTKKIESESKKKKNKKITKRMKTELKKDKSFNLLVQNYKQKMLSVDSAPQKKWYED